MSDNIVESKVLVSGVRSNDDVTKALQALYDVFASAGLGQATFEVTDESTMLFVKHLSSVDPDLATIDAALRRAGDYRALSID